MTDIVERAKAALELWDNTLCVSIEVHTGMVAAEDAYRNAPDIVRELVTEVERFRFLCGGQGRMCHELPASADRLLLKRFLDYLRDEDEASISMSEVDRFLAADYTEEVR